MSEQQDVSEGSLLTLDGIRARFQALQRTSGKGFHALGEEVLSAYFQATELPRPVSAMTFRNFLQGKPLRDPTGLELYFRALGATEQDMRTIRSTLQHELDRRLASPRTQATLKAFDDLDIANLPYSRVLAECEVVTRLEGSVSAPVTHLTPREYLFGPDGTPDAGPDPERWGLLQHLDDLTRYLAKLDHALAEGLEAIPRSARRKRRLQAAADLREAASAYVNWLLYRPRGGDLLFSRRRFMLHGYFPEADRQLAIARAKRASRLLFGFLDRFAYESLVRDKRDEAQLRTPQAEVALEVVAERMMAIINSFYFTVVQGSVGTGAMFRAGYQLRQENAAVPGGFTEMHQQLISSYDAALLEGNRRLEEDLRMPYETLRKVFDAQCRAARPVMFEVWKRDYAGGLVRQCLQLLISELHHHNVLDDARVLTLTKELCLGRPSQELFDACHAQRFYEPLDD